MLRRVARRPPAVLWLMSFCSAAASQRSRNVKNILKWPICLEPGSKAFRQRLDVTASVRSPITATKEGVDAFSISMFVNAEAQHLIYKESKHFVQPNSIESIQLENTHCHVWHCFEGHCARSVTFSCFPGVFATDST